LSYNLSQIFREDVPEARAGENVGVQLRGVKAAALEKGMLLIAPGSLKPTNHFEVALKRSDEGAFLFV